jgi:hypothetical protein
MVAAAAVTMASWAMSLVLVVALMAGLASQPKVEGHGGEKFAVAGLSQCCVHGSA